MTKDRTINNDNGFRPPLSRLLLPEAPVHESATTYELCYGPEATMPDTLATQKLLKNYEVCSQE